MTSAPTTTPQEQASTVTAFAKDLQSQISSTSASSSPLAIPDDTLRTLDIHINHLPLSRKSLTISTRQQLDTRGTELWNTCLQVMGACREGGIRSLLSKVKCLAFAMVESAAPRRGSGNVRVLELALRAAKDCLESEHFELGLKALETAAARLDTFEKSEADMLRLSAATMEYYMLRIYLSWFHGRPDIAEHLFSKTSDTQGSLEQQKTAIEVCYIIGSSALSKGQPDIAVRWLERALKSSSCSNQDSKPSDLALKDMRLLILHTLVRSRLQLNTPNSRDCALQVLNSLKTEYRDIYSVVMLQLEFFSKEEHLNYNDYFECLETAVRMMELTDVTLKTTFYHIQKLSNHSWNFFMKVSRQLLLEKLIPSGNHILIGQYFVAFVWMVTNSNKPASQELDTIVDAAKILTQSGTDALSEDAAHASLALIWRRVESMISNGDIFMAEQWCLFVLEHPIFQNCSATNRGVVQRKLMTCALDNPDTSLTHEALERILERSHDAPSTLYLAYMITLLHDESDLGTNVLEALYKLGANGATFLLSCAAEAQRLGKMQQMVDSIQPVIAILDSGCHEGLDFPTLVGSTLRILSTELDNCKADNTKILEQIHRTFQAALKGSTDSSTFSRNDIQWLFQKSYNLSLQLVMSSRYSAAIELLDISLKLADLYPQTAELKDTSKIPEHNLSCSFLKALILIIEAREETDTLGKKNHYTNLRNTIEHFRAQVANHPQLQQNLETTVPKTWHENYRALLSFNFEAAIFLSQWDSLPRIIEESNPFADPRLCAVFLDSILSADTPVSEMVKVVMTIINTLHTSSSPILNKSFFEASLPCYLRCLFQLSLQANETPLAEAIIDKAISLACGYDDNTNTDKDNNAVATSNGKNNKYDYPNEELEWLATMTFNRAIDFYLVSADEECRRWAKKAIEVADLVGYNHGALGRLLRANLAKLS